ncbi:hypothetical protein DEH80_08025 [Abyssibacter profundi]|uniref:Norphogenetic protein n=1 Tax=Abyssibacter profundi TaxID=2182787 RepID=A0A363ULB0_9GAMM|nr:hypothetical protein DEH80_08025 [Abyssibacter profundi]
MSFGAVTGTAHRVLIVAGGPSARPLRGRCLPPSVHVIAVNGAADWLPRFDAWITVDPSAANRSRMRNPRPVSVRYYACVPDDYGQPTARCLDHRAPPEPGITWLRRLTGFGPWGARAGLSADPAGLHTGNSAYAALGVAYLMRASRIVLAGVDGSSAARVDGGHPRDLTHLPALFASATGELARAGCEVVNANPFSAVSCFPRRPLDEALGWLSGARKSHLPL